MVWVLEAVVGAIFAELLSLSFFLFLSPHFAWFFLDLARLFLHKITFMAALYPVLCSRLWSYSCQSSHVSLSCLSLQSFGLILLLLFCVISDVMQYWCLMLCICLHFSNEFVFSLEMHASLWKLCFVVYYQWRFYWSCKLHICVCLAINDIYKDLILWYS